MKIISLIIFLLVSSYGFAQSKREISLKGSYQFYDKEAFSFGAGSRIKNSWPKMNMESFADVSLHGIVFLNQPGDEKIYGFQTKVFISSKFVGIGMVFRLMFQDNLSRYDAGPAVKVGYKFIWLEYAPTFLIYNNFLKGNSDTVKMDFNKVEQNINLTISIPIVKMKE